MTRPPRPVSRAAHAQVPPDHAPVSPAGAAVPPDHAPSPPGPLSRTFGGEVRRAVSYERGLAVKALFCLAVIALIIAAEVRWG
jgi:hypothetical protein